MHIYFLLDGPVYALRCKRPDFKQMFVDLVDSLNSLVHFCATLYINCCHRHQTLTLHFALYCILFIVSIQLLLLYQINHYLFFWWLCFHCSGLCLVMRDRVMCWSWSQKEVCFITVIQSSFSFLCSYVKYKLDI